MYTSKLMNEEGASLSHYILTIEKQIVIVYNMKHRCLLLTKSAMEDGVYGKCIYLYASFYADTG